ncbi:cellulase family glycosylhydrolase [Williamsia serinedens]|uniref:LGFP repeat-containing protein n=1 Tax=Williamsia serinedens TaxID=391736 RepID=A0ABT1H661_9NOCA|nr:cellulase family glycosylhydrolase [Williamsia serinedens]MCP2162719.1 LGFP repeat-containing protein [Williamsia serinedens]
MPRPSRRRLLAVVAVMLLTTVLAGCGSSGPGTAPTTSAKVGVGDRGHGFGIALGAEVYWQGTSATDADLDAIAAAGLGSIRLPVFWSAIQPVGPSVSLWSVVDHIVDGARARGLQVMATVGGSPPWAGDPAANGGPYAAPRDIGQWSTFVRAVAQRYKGRVSTYEVWNEPNSSVFFAPRVDPARYTQLLRAAHAAIEQTDPAATVVAGALGTVVDTATTGDPVDFVRQMYADGAAGSFDALSVHPYKYDLGLSEAWTVPDSPGRQIAEMRRLMDDNGDGGKRMWATEYGLPTSAVGLDRQAAMIAGFAGDWQQLPFAGPVFWYTLRDKASGVPDDEDNFGLIRTDRSPKPAVRVVADLARSGVTPSPDAQRFADAPLDADGGEIVSPVFRATRSGVLARFQRDAAVYLTPRGYVTTTPRVALAAISADTYPIGLYGDDHQDLADGTTVFATDDGGVHVIGGGVMDAWSRSLGAALTDETPVGGGAVRVDFQRGSITWSPDRGAIRSMS